MVVRTYRAEYFSVVVVEKLFEQLEHDLALAHVEPALLVNPDLKLVHALLTYLPAAAI